MRIENIRKTVGREVIDYQTLLSLLSNYLYPRDKITEWLKSGDLIRVKKGLYVFGKNVQLTPYSLEVLANLIYGPSAVSLSYALSYYGLIPERVTTITSITNKRNKLFLTPVGEFTYQYLNPTKYPVGIELMQSATKNNFLMASLEKALCDYIFLVDKKVELNNIADIETYLMQDLRVDENILQTIKLQRLIEICRIYEDPRLNLLITFIKKWK
jgi:hypothetical protein